MWWLFDCKAIHGLYCAVWTDANDIIMVAPPIVSKFIGQPITNLRRWIEGKGGCSYRMDWR